MFTVIGEALLDMVQPTVGDTYRALPAGGPLNIAVGLRRLGHPTSMMARLSTGALGQRIRAYAVENGLDLSASPTTDLQATLAFATIDARGQADYDFFVNDTADWGWTAAELANLPTPSRAVHSGSLATILEPGAAEIAEFWADQFSQGDRLLSFDPNIRPMLTGPRETARRTVERFVATSHVVKASDDDLGLLYPDVDPVLSLRTWSDLGPSLVVLTRGPLGCVAVTSDGEVLELPAPPVDVVDTIGAGDAFQAGLLSGLADTERLSPAAVAAMGGDDVGLVLERALAVAALTCTRSGANPPTRAEYEEFGRPARDGRVVGSGVHT